MAPILWVLTSPVKSCSNSSPSSLFLCTIGTTSPLSKPLRAGLPRGISPATRWSSARRLSPRLRRSSCSGPKEPGSNGSVELTLTRRLGPPTIGLPTMDLAYSGLGWLTREPAYASYTYLHVLDSCRDDAPASAHPFFNEAATPHPRLISPS